MSTSSWNGASTLDYYGQDQDYILDEDRMTCRSNKWVLFDFTVLQFRGTSSDEDIQPRARHKWGVFDHDFHDHQRLRNYKNYNKKTKIFGFNTFSTESAWTRFSILGFVFLLTLFLAYLVRTLTYVEIQKYKRHK